MTKAVFVVGNTADPKDRFPLGFLPLLKKRFPDIAFLPFDPTEEFPPHPSHLVLIDAVEGISRVALVSDADAFSLPPRVTVHEYDLALHLRLLQKLGRLRKLTVIGVPMTGNRQRIFSDLAAALSSIAT
jgi:hypothetical protein